MPSLHLSLVKYSGRGQVLCSAQASGWTQIWLKLLGSSLCLPSVEHFAPEGAVILIQTFRTPLVLVKVLRVWMRNTEQRAECPSLHRVSGISSGRSCVLRCRQGSMLNRECLLNSSGSGVSSRAVFLHTGLTSPHCYAFCKQLCLNMRRAPTHLSTGARIYTK